MAVTGVFVGLSLAQLQTLQTEYLACLSAIAVAGQSYTIANRQFNRAQLDDVKELLGEINHALAQTAGSSTAGSSPTQTFARFN
jgi:hypothetical protein